MPNDFPAVSIQGDDDRLHTHDFFQQIVEKYPVKKDGKRLKIITVNHILSTTPYFLSALEKIGDIVSIIPKGSWKDTYVLDRLRSKYSNIIVQVTKEYLQQPQNAVSFIREKVNADEYCIILDIGGYFAHALAEFNQQPDIPSRLVGIVEDTENGHQKYEQALAGCPNNKIPIYSSARIKLKGLEDYNVGKSLVHAAETLLRTNAATIIERFKCIVVLGYGKIGQSMAEHLRQKNVKRLVVYDVNNLQAGMAASQGHEVITQEEERKIVLQDADLIFCGTGNKALKNEDWRLLKDNVFIASCTSKDDELDTTFLEQNARSIATQHATQFTLFNKTINLLAGGNAVNFVFGAVNGPYVYNVQASIIVGMHAITSQNESSVSNKDKIYEISESAQKEVLDFWLKNFEAKVVADPLVRNIDPTLDMRQKFDEIKKEPQQAQPLNVKKKIEVTDGAKAKFESVTTSGIIDQGSSSTAYAPGTLTGYISTHIKVSGKDSEATIGPTTTAGALIKPKK